MSDHILCVKKPVNDRSSVIKRKVINDKLYKFGKNYNKNAVRYFRKSLSVGNKPVRMKKLF